MMAGKAQTEAGQCKQIRQAAQLTALVSNTTKLDEITQGNTTKADAIKAKATVLQAEAATLSANATLVADCEVINAVAEEGNECNMAFLLQKFVTFAANDTAVSILVNNNQTKIDDLKAKAAKASEKLAVLNANATLTADCPAMATKEACSLMKGLTKFVAFTSNQTLLDAVTQGDAAKAAELKADGQLAQDQLDIMSTGAPTAADCTALKAAGKPAAPVDAPAAAKRSPMDREMDMTAAEMETNNTISSNSAAGLKSSVIMVAFSSCAALAIFMSML